MVVQLEIVGYRKKNLPCDLFVVRIGNTFGPAFIFKHLLGQKSDVA